MKSLLGFVSISMWAAALIVAPAPAEAWNAKYGTIVDYFSCSQYQTITPTGCYWYDGDGTRISQSFYGKMMNTIPVSMCAGSCNGTEQLLVQCDPGNGRKTRYDWMQCSNGYVLALSPCNSCS